MTVTRVEIVRPLEPGLTSVVLAASMKTPHRSLRSNEIEISSDGTLNVQMEVTFSLQVSAHHILPGVCFSVHAL